MATTQDTSALNSMLDELQRALGAEFVLGAQAAIERYGASTSNVIPRIEGAMRVGSVAELQNVLRVAARYKISIYPVSTGHNWGYGSANPVTDGCVLVDLSRMDRILEMDADLGLVTLEPGVTQGTLRQYLDDSGLPFMVPVHGGGPSCSLVGNALERGYGITPYTDHFAAVTALEAILPDGQLYRSAMADLGAVEADRNFKWGIGPYLDGLFAQANFGVVTQMTIALAPVPERIDTFFFRLADEADLEKAVFCVRQALRELGSIVGAINLMNTRRMLSMMAPFPGHLLSASGLISEEGLVASARKYRLPPWTGVGALYGSKEVVKAARRTLKRRLKPVARRLIFVRPQWAHRVGAVAERIPRMRNSALAQYMRSLRMSLDIMHGRPSEVALPLAYWRSGEKPGDGRLLNPARDGCGLIWFAPLVTMKPERVRAYVAMIESVCAEHGIEPLVTLTTLSDRSFDSTVPILFDAEDEAAAARAWACYRALIDAGIANGFVPYRAHVSAMGAFKPDSSVFWNMAEVLKQALDPVNTIAPGRYIAPRS